jgi:hypothetical protein
MSDNREKKPTDYLMWNDVMKRYETYTFNISWLDAYHFIMTKEYIKINNLKCKEYSDGKTIADL